MKIIEHDVVKGIPLDSDSVDGVITSPPYFQECNYQQKGQLGLEPTLDGYLGSMCQVFSDVQRVMKNGSVCYTIIGDSSNVPSAVRAKGERRAPTAPLRRPKQPGKEKQALLVPFRLATALEGVGLYCRNVLIWVKPNSGAIARSDTAAKSHEYILQLFKWDKPGRPYLNTRPVPGVIVRSAASHPKHPCPLPQPLVSTLARSFKGEGLTILDPFAGVGTVGTVAESLGHTSHCFDLVDWNL